MGDRQTSAAAVPTGLPLSLSDGRGARLEADAAAGQLGITVVEEPAACVARFDPGRLQPLLAALIATLAPTDVQVALTAGGDDTRIANWVLEVLGL